MTELAHHPELERAVAEAPRNDPSAWLVYEDWLMAQGDPRGRLAELERLGDRRALDAERERLAPVLLGPGHERLLRLVDGVYWRGGFVQLAHLYLRADELDAALAPFLASPAARLLSELYLSEAKSSSILATIGAATHLRELRLRIADPINRSAVPMVADLSLLAALDQLESATLDGFEALAGGHRHLRFLTMSTRRPVSLDALAAELPALTSFDLACSELAHDGRAITTWPALWHLGIQIDRCEPDPVELVVQTGLAAQLRRLRITDGVPRTLPAPHGVWPHRREPVELDAEAKPTYRGGVLARIEKVYLAPPLVQMTYPCPCCGYPTLDEPPPGTYEICPVCLWEDDPVQGLDPTYRGGANEASLDEARASFAAIGASDPRHAARVRPPTADEIRRRAPS